MNRTITDCYLDILPAVWGNPFLHLLLASVKSSCMIFFAVSLLPSGFWNSLGEHSVDGLIVCKDLKCLMQVNAW